MSEDVPEYNRQSKNKGEIKFVRLRSIPEDLIGYVTYKEDYLIIEKPLRIDIETIFDEGRQILAMQEYLPQSVISIQEVEFYMEEVLFSTPVRDEFIEQYEYVSDFFYNNVSKIKSPTKPNLEPVKDTSEKINKVVSILEAMASKKDKPVH